MTNKERTYKTIENFLLTIAGQDFGMVARVINARADKNDEVLKEILDEVIDFAQKMKEELDCNDNK